MAIALYEAKEYLHVGYGDDDRYISELIDTSEAYIDGCAGTAYKYAENYENQEEFEKGQRLFALLQKKIIGDMYDIRGTTVSNNTNQDTITKTILEKLANVG